VADGAHIEINIREKRFAVLSRPLFERFRLTIEASSHVCLVGPSGVGKSSLLRMIAGIDMDFVGSIEVDGVDAGIAPTPGFVFQDPRLLPWLSSIGNIRAASPGISAHEAEALLKKVGLEGFERAFPHELSGGMQRRVALARALAVRPKVLLLDEPFVSLDRALVEEFQDVFVQVTEVARPTVIPVTHQPEDAARLADRAIVLSGRPVAIVRDFKIETPRARRHAPECARIAAEIGAPMELDSP